MHIKPLTAALAALLLAACNPMAQLNDAESHVDAFHETYNTGDAQALYGQTGDEFRDITSPAQMDELVAVVSDRMGKVVSTEREGININSNNGVNTTTVTMKTVFEKGEATETFIFTGSGEEMSLAGWNIDSANFVDTATVEPVEIDLPEREVAD